jgi:replicative DNA helicase
LFKKYLIVYTDLIAKINAYSGLVEATALLKSLNAVSDKVVGLYSEETKDLEKKLKAAETTEQIQTIILGQ